MPKVLVTGGSGFVAPHLIKLLIQKGYDVHCLVRYTSNISALRNLPVTIHAGDVRDPATLETPVKDAVYIFHLAAVLLDTNQAAFENTNVTGTKHMLEAAEKFAQASLKRFVLVSSLACAGPNPTLTPYDETTPLNPISWYGKSKQKAEAIAAAFKPVLPITIVRPAIVYGENEQDLSQIFPLAEMRIQPKLGVKSKAMVCVYVGDLVAGMVAAAESEKAKGQTYFLNHADIISSAGIVKGIGTAMGKENGLVIPVPNLIIKAAAPFSEFIFHFNSKRAKMTRDKAREVTQRYWIASPDKAKNDFGWVAANDIVGGMKRTIPAYMADKVKVRQMALEKPFILWLKYFVIAILLGCVVEFIAHLGGFYQFYPSWLVYVVILVAFGLIFASLAKALRTKSSLIQLVIGILSAGVIEALNVLGVFPHHYWIFADGWPLGIHDPWLRTAVLSLPGGIFILLLNFILRNSYKNRLRLRGDL
jgi:nucleoside-diphosphate-sugar epimerase